MTQHLSEADVRGIAEYTRIGLDAEEVVAMTADLNAIIDSLRLSPSSTSTGSSRRSIPSATCPTSCAMTRCAGASPRKWRWKTRPSRKTAASSSRPSWGKGAIANGAHLQRNGHSRDSNRSRRQGVLGRRGGPRHLRAHRRGRRGGCMPSWKPPRNSRSTRRLGSTPPVAEGRLAEMGPLAGVPVGYKDNLNLTGMHTTCSSNMLRDYVSPYTATCVEKTLRAGALPIGKLNMDEFAFGGSTETSAFGPTFNPWDVERVPGGSSAEAPRPWRRALCRCRSGRIRRLHPPTGLVLRSGGREAHLRRGVALRCGGLRQLARPGGPLRPFGGGCGARAERAFRPRRAGLHEPAVRRGLHGQPR